jgi:very-short-patch-repair endonuclease
VGKEKRNQARFLRNNMTKPERLLWSKLSRDQMGFQFRRQDPFGPYILDFYCPEYFVAIEIDGLVHEGKKNKDEVRDSYLIEHGVQVLRFTASSVLRSPEAVAYKIKIHLEALKAAR